MNELSKVCFYNGLLIKRFCVNTPMSALDIGGDAAKGVTSKTFCASRGSAALGALPL